jgi:alcohol dehydrogenase
MPFVSIHAYFTYPIPFYSFAFPTC